MEAINPITNQKKNKQTNNQILSNTYNLAFHSAYAFLPTQVYHFQANRAVNDMPT